MKIEKPIVDYRIDQPQQVHGGEGGKYAELMALLPTFVKEKFVQEFEEYCDAGWVEDLKVFDPVNA